MQPNFVELVYRVSTRPAYCYTCIFTTINILHIKLVIISASFINNRYNIKSNNTNKTLLIYIPPLNFSKNVINILYEKNKRHTLSVASSYLNEMSVYGEGASSDGSVFII